MTEFGNKGLFIVGLGKFYGQSRDRMTRLKDVAKMGDTKVLVYPGLDWAQWDRVAVAPSAM